MQYVAEIYIRFLFSRVGWNESYISNSLIIRRLASDSNLLLIRDFVFALCLFFSSCSLGSTIYFESNPVLKFQQGSDRFKSRSLHDWVVHRDLEFFYFIFLFKWQLTRLSKFYWYYRKINFFSNIIVLWYEYDMEFIKLSPFFRERFYFYFWNLWIIKIEFLETRSI